MREWGQERKRKGNKRRKDSAILTPRTDRGNMVMASYFPFADLNLQRASFLRWENAQSGLDDGLLEPKTGG